jgi:hypothetical protein
MARTNHEQPASHQLINSSASAEWTAIDARRLTDEVKADAQRLWAKLLRLYEGGAHTALGYSSWADYCQQEFKLGKTRSYQLLNAARVIDQFTIVDSPQVTSQVPESEAIARELVPLLSNPQALDEAWNESVEQAGGVPTAQVVRDVVARSPISPISYGPSMWPGLSGKDGCRCVYPLTPTSFNRGGTVIAPWTAE